VLVGAMELLPYRARWMKMWRNMIFTVKNVDFVDSKSPGSQNVVALEYSTY